MTYCFSMRAVGINFTLGILEVVIMQVEIRTRFSDAIRRYIMTIEGRHITNITMFSNT